MHQGLELIPPILPNLICEPAFAVALLAMLTGCCGGGDEPQSSKEAAVRYSCTSISPQPAQVASGVFATSLPAGDFDLRNVSGKPAAFFPTAGDARRMRLINTA